MEGIISHVVHGVVYVVGAIYSRDKAFVIGDALDPSLASR